MHDRVVGALVGVMGVALAACPAAEEEDSGGISTEDEATDASADTTTEAGTGPGEGTSAGETASEETGSTTSAGETGSTTSAGDTASTTGEDTSSSEEGETRGDTTTGGGACTPGERVACYGGPPGTVGVGLCAWGEAPCNDEGVLGPCEGAVLPAFDGCLTPADEDCDGQTPECTGEALWGRLIGGVGQDYAGRAAFGLDGEVHVVGEVNGGVFEPDSGVEIPGLGVFFARYSATGAYLAGGTFGGANVQYGLDLAVRPDGNTLAVGRSVGITDFGEGAGPVDGCFILLIDPAGELLWSEQFGPSCVMERVAYDAQADEIIVFGEYSGAGFDLGVGALPDSLLGENFFARFDGDGQALWSKDLDSDSVGDIHVDIAPDGSFGLAGRYSQTLILDGQVVGDGGGGVFWARMSAAGELEFAGTASGENFADTVIAVAESGEFWVAGDGAYWVPGSPLMGLPLPGALEDGGFVARFDAEGTFLGHRELDGEDLDITDVAVGPDGAGVVVGDFQMTIDIGGGSLSSDGQDVFVAKYDDQVDLAWATLGTTDSIWALFIPHVTVGPDGRVLASGPTGGGAAMDFGAGPISGNSNANDILVAVFAP